MPAIAPVKPSQGAPGVHPTINKPTAIKSSSSQAQTGGADDTLDLQQHGQDVEIPQAVVYKALREIG